MSNQTAAAYSAMGNSVNWERKGLDLQAIIQAGNQGRLSGPLTDWLVSQAWNQGKFIVRQKFVVDTKTTFQPRIRFIGDNFRTWYFGAVEEITTCVKLTSFILEERMSDENVIIKIGGVDRALTWLQDIFGILEEQPLGPKSSTGDLLTNGYANIFFVPQVVEKLDGNQYRYSGLDGKWVIEEVKDPKYLFKIKDQWFVLRTVFVYWDDDGWDIGADSVGRPLRWGVGFQVFSRNSDLKSLETLVPVQA